MTGGRIAPGDLRAALLDLALVAAGFVRGSTRRQARIELGRAIARANAMRGARLDAAPAPLDPDTLIVNYIERGGDWPALTAAVNRHALRGSTRRMAG